MDLPDVTLSLCGGLSENGEISKGMLDSHACLHLRRVARSSLVLTSVFVPKPLFNKLLA